MRHRSIILLTSESPYARVNAATRLPCGSTSMNFHLNNADMQKSLNPTFGELITLPAAFLILFHSAYHALGKLICFRFGQGHVPVILALIALLIWQRLPTPLFPRPRLIWLLRGVCAEAKLHSKRHRAVSDLGSHDFKLGKIPSLQVPSMRMLSRNVQNNSIEPVTYWVRTGRPVFSNAWEQCYEILTGGLHGRRIDGVFACFSQVLPQGANAKAQGMSNVDKLSLNVFGCA